MKVTKVIGLAAVGALLVLVAPTDGAQAMTLNSPGIAAAAQVGSKSVTTQVGWGWGHRRHHRHWGRGHRRGWRG